ncbi:MAG: hypothetical protein WCM93_14810, partial [Bacteroidota bacterium]
MKKTTFKAVFVMAILLLGFLQVGKAQLLVENFDYTSGTLLTANGWTVLNAGCTNATTVTTPVTITYGGYLSSGIGNEVTMPSSGEDDNKAFTSQNAGSLYSSFLVNVTSSSATGDYFAHFAATSGATVTVFGGRVWIKKDATTSNFAFGISKSSTTANISYTGFTYTPGVTYLVVVKYTFIAGLTNDVASLFINPVLNAVEPSPTIVTLTADNATADPTQLTSYCLRQGGATSAPSVKLDGIRVGTTWADIVGSAGTPTITAGSLTGFGYQAVNTTSAEKNYTVAGTLLQGNIVIAPPAGFEISTTLGGPYTANPGTITLSPTAGTVASTPIYVVFHPTSVQAYAGNILHTSTNAIDVNVAVSGTSIVSNPEPTNHATNFAAGTTTATAIPLTW